MAINFGKLEEITRALKSSKQTGKSFHTTFAFRGNKLLSIGINNYNKQHPSHKFGKYVPTKSEGNYIAGIHSEISSVIKLGLEDCSDITFVNLRIDNNNKLANSKPCLNCNRVLDQLGYKNIWYFDGHSFIKLQTKH
jgi:prepilin-type processing-associated H-X9-DG protein